MSAKDRQVAGSHYKGGKIQVWDIWEAFDLDGFHAAVIKYVLRPEKSEGSHLEDLKKAHHTLERMIEIEEEKRRPKIRFTVRDFDPGGIRD